MEERIYLDNAATTKVDERVIKAMLPYYTERYGNASSLHTDGQIANLALEEARKVIAHSINADPKEIIFTSGGTEANNFALKSVAFTNKDKGNNIIISKIEHKCIVDTCKWLEKQGFTITFLDVDKEGYVLPETLEKAITSKTILVSIIHGHNEIGTIQNLEALGAICRKHNVYFHTDSCQSFTKIKIDVKLQNLDLVTLNAHKIHGPKGVGALYIRKGVKIKVWQHGGAQEQSLRSGTENIPGIVGFAESVKIADNLDVLKMIKMRDSIIEKILRKIPYTALNGPSGENRLCNNINISFDAIEGEALIEYLDIEGAACSTGSACSSKSLDPSHTLMAIGLDHQHANGSIRISISKYTTETEAMRFVEILAGVVDRLRKMSPFQVGVK